MLDAPSGDLSPAFALRRLIIGHRVTDMIAVATRLGLADMYGERAKRNQDGAVSDLNMLIFLPGCERSLAQERALLSAARFAVTNVLPTRALMSIVEAAGISSSYVVAAPSSS
jgi:hypothetical protein